MPFTNLDQASVEGGWNGFQQKGAVVRRSEWSSGSRPCARPTPMLVRARTRCSSGTSSRPTPQSRVGRIASFRRARLPWCKRPFMTHSTRSTAVTSRMSSKRGSGRSLPRLRPQSRRPHTMSWWDSSRRKPGSLDAAYATALSTVADGPTKEAGTAVGSGCSCGDSGAPGNRRCRQCESTGPHPAPSRATINRRLPNAPVVTPGWGEVDPFVLENLAALHPPPPYSLEDLRYAQDFAEVKSIGAAQSAGAK